MMSEHNVLVLIPSRGLVNAQTLDSIWREMENTPQVRAWDIQISGRGTTFYVREKLMELFEKTPEADCALWVDDDVVVPDGCVQTMLDTPGDLVGCHVPNRGTDDWNGFFKHPDNMRAAGETVNWCGLALCLMRRDALRVPPPRFGEPKPKGNTYYGEDNNFNGKCQQYKLQLNHVPLVAKHLELRVLRGRFVEPPLIIDEPGGHEFHTFPEGK